MAVKPSTMAYFKKRTRRFIEQDINEKLLRLGTEMAEDVGNLMVEYARNLLKTRATPSPESQGLINQIAESIHLEDVEQRAVFSSTKNNKKIVGGKVMRVPIDKNNLVMFLEYGTGLEGDKNHHPNADNIGWRYAINDGTEKVITMKSGPNYTKRKIYKKWYTKVFSSTQRGFVFKYTGRQYLDRKDKIFKNGFRLDKDDTSTKFSFIRGHIDKKTGKKTADYFRRVGFDSKATPTQTEYAFSSGLKATRFIYDTKTKGLPEILSQYQEEFKK